MQKSAELTDKGLEPLLGSEGIRITRFTNQHNIRFYIARDKEIHQNTHSHKPETYLNFYGFFKQFDEYQKQQVMMTFGVAKNYQKANGLDDRHNLLIFLQEYGLIEFRKFLNEIKDYGAYDRTIILKFGDIDIIPQIRNDKIAFPSYPEDDERLIRHAEGIFCRLLIENKGQRLLHQIDIIDECFVPNKILRFVESRLFIEKYIHNKNYGILSAEGETLFRRIINGPYIQECRADNLIEVIQGGESDQLEFKSSLRWDEEKKIVNPELEYMVIKAISAFSNSDGGILLIGVSNDGKILGLEGDLNCFKTKGDNDLYERHIVQLLINAFGARVAKAIASVKFISFGDKQVCVLKVPSGMEPIFLEKANAEKFFVRVGNSTREITSPGEITAYCIKRFRGAI
jgi:hypothetical protein